MRKMPRPIPPIPFFRVGFIYLFRPFYTSFILLRNSGSRFDVVNVLIFVGITIYMKNGFVIFTLVILLPEFVASLARRGLLCFL